MRPGEEELRPVLGFERWNRVRLLGGKAEELPTGHEELQVGAACEQP
jgi:hypothetical protein